MIQLPAKDGKPSITIEYRPSFCFPMHILQRFTPELRSRMERERANYKRSRRQQPQSRQQGELEAIVAQQQAQICLLYTSDAADE